MHRTHLTAALSSLLGLAACATPPAEPVTSLGEKTCAAAYDLAAARSLAPPAAEQAFWEVSAPLDAAAACVDGSNGLVFSLAGTEGKVVRAGTRAEPKRVVPTRVRLLDAAGRVLREWSGDAVPFRMASHVVAFTPAPGEAYLVVEAQGDRVGGSMERVAPTGYMTPSQIVVPIPAGTYPYSHEGEVLVTVGSRRTEVTDKSR